MQVHALPFVMSTELFVLHQLKGHLIKIYVSPGVFIIEDTH